MKCEISIEGTTSKDKQKRNLMTLEMKAASQLSSEMGKCFHRSEPQDYNSQHAAPYTYVYWPSRLGLVQCDS